MGELRCVKDKINKVSGVIPLDLFGYFVFTGWTEAYVGRDCH